MDEHLLLLCNSINYQTDNPADIFYGFGSKRKVNRIHDIDFFDALEALQNAMFACQ